MAINMKKKSNNRKYPDINNEGGFLRIRNGIWEHVKLGRISSNDLSVYLTIQRFADIKLGICYSTASSLASNWGEFSSAKNKVEQFQNAMRRLRDNGYIDYPNGVGQRGAYPILIDKAEPTDGPLRGWRLRLCAGEPGSSDFTNPWYQYVSPTPWEDYYGDIQVDDTPVAWRVVQVVDTTVDQIVAPRVDEPVDIADDTAVALPLEDVLRIRQDIQRF